MARTCTARSARPIRGKRVLQRSEVGRIGRAAVERTAALSNHQRSKVVLIAEPSGIIECRLRRGGGVGERLIGADQSLGGSQRPTIAGGFHFTLRPPNF